jgi:hypothetical protein
MLLLITKRSVAPCGATAEETRKPMHSSECPGGFEIALVPLDGIINA